MGKVLVGSCSSVLGASAIESRLKVLTCRQCVYCWDRVATRVQVPCDVSVLSVALQHMICLEDNPYVYLMTAAAVAT